MLTDLTITIRRGASAQIPIRIETENLSFANITAMTRAAPIQITAPGHGLPEGWRAWVMNAGGMTELNSAWNNLKDSGAYRVSVLDVNNVELPDVNSSGFRAYTSGGQLAYRSPLDLSQFTSARMDVKTTPNSTPIVSFNTAGGTLQLDAAANVLWLILPTSTTGSLSAATRFFDIELVKASGDVVAACSANSKLIILPEITTST